MGVNRTTGGRELLVAVAREGGDDEAVATDAADLVCCADQLERQARAVRVAVHGDIELADQRLLRLPRLRRCAEVERAGARLPHYEVPR